MPRWVTLFTILLYIWGDTSYDKLPSKVHDKNSKNQRVANLNVKRMHFCSKSRQNLTPAMNCKGLTKGGGGTNGVVMACSGFLDLTKPFLVTWCKIIHFGQFNPFLNPFQFIHDIKGSPQTPPNSREYHQNP